MGVDLKGRLAVVTGATRGIGRAIATQLSEAGASVTGTGTGKRPAHADWFDRYIQTDFGDLAEIKSCAEVLRRMSPDILVNNAGINKIAPFAKIHLDDFLLVQQVNLTAPFILCQAVIPGMKKRGWGRIINISSIWGKISKSQRASYSASKFALDGLTLALATEHAGDGILANCLAPGLIDTELTRKVLGKDQITQILAGVPAGRMAQAEEIARFVTWLASSDNTYISGQNIAIDGGFSRA